MSLNHFEIKKNLSIVQTGVERAARMVGRSVDDIRLVVVTKSQPIETIQLAIEAGIRIFGENYPQEALPKILAFTGEKIEWHMIGHLQSRKAQIVAEHFICFHALDRVNIAIKLDNLLSEMQKNLPVLLEVNVAGEITKHGWQIDNEDDWAVFVSDIEKIYQIKNLRICGLMTMPPFTENPEVNRHHFKKIREIQEKLDRQFPNINWQELSMGTSMDFEVAIQEGATMVRIGQAILGSR